jgi:hypothetical protein
MKQDEKRGPGRRYANASDVSQADEPSLTTPTGRENHSGAAGPGLINEDEVQRIDVGAVPRSSVTAHRQPGTSAEENEDGLSELEEAVRHAAPRTRRLATAWRICLSSRCSIAGLRRRKSNR